MNTFVSSCIAILVVSSTVQSSVLPRYKRAANDSAGKFTLPSEWLRISIKNDTLIRVPAGSSLLLECEAVGSPPPSLRWHHGDTLISEISFPDQNEIGNNVAIGKLRSRVYIDCVKPRDQGLYTCSGAAGSRKRNPPAISVFVEESDELISNVCLDSNKPMAPHILTYSPTLLEFSERDVVLPCRVTGNPTPAVSWLNNMGEPIDPKTDARGYRVLESGELLISHLIWDDMGTYTCRANNTYGQDEAETFLYPVKRAEEA